MDAGVVTARERDVLELLGDHLTHEEIAQRLVISIRTVESHVAALRRKLNLPTHRSLVRFAVEERQSDRTHASAPPVALSSFVGRQSELAELTAALVESRLVSAVGPGGVGKTRLALAVAEKVAVENADRVRWADLVPVTESAQLEDAVAVACGAVVSSRRGPVEAIAWALRDRPVLLVLDNCEHLVNAVAGLVERLLTVCPELTVLLTSRVRLALAFERVFRVDGLSADVDGDAVALFVERAVAAGGAVPSDTEHERIGAVCAALGGLALAVELVAVRMPSLGLDGVERALLDQERLLVSDTGSNPRHRSMHETLDWSMALLDEASAVALRRLCVLVVPFDVDAAAAVAAFAPLSPDDVRAALTQLAEHNLLTTTTIAQGRVSHRLLEPIRQYALAGLTDDDRPAFGHHLAWCLRSITALLPDQQPDAVHEVADDARAALAWAAGQHRPDPTAHALARGFGLLLFRDGSLREAQARMEQAADFTSDGVQAATDLARAAAVAKCRVLGEEALRLELAAAGRARQSDPTVAARAFVRAAELLNRFSGMFASVDEWSADDLMHEARLLAPDDSHVGAAIAVATACSDTGEGYPSPSIARAALAAARGVADVLLESAALDAASNSEAVAGNVLEAGRLAAERVARLMSWRDEPAAGLELKDALRMATFYALGGGDLATARDMAQRQHAMPFLREHRDLADEELLPTAALAGDWATVLTIGERFLEEWTAAGRPSAPGRALAIAAVALALGLRGAHDEQSHWLGVLAAIRGVPRADAWRGTGYGELFEAMVMLHENQPRLALDILAAGAADDVYAAIFGQWSAAIMAEAAVLANSNDAELRVDEARTSCVGNPIATILTRRAAALLSGNLQALESIADDFGREGASYQQSRTAQLRLNRLPLFSPDALS